MGEMTKDVAYAFLDSRPGWIVLSTIDGKGYPHAVPLGYFRDGDDVYVPARGQRRVNIARNPKVSLLLETGGAGMGELKGLVIQGDAALVEEPDEVLRLSRRSATLRGTTEDKLPTSIRPGTAFARVTIRKMRSWDNSA
jgi:nitroimidazol reductase NimA-like FMN-containing flavoprotein (pyridoxamine 5'-phosphate oxidase superfamily)